MPTSEETARQKIKQLSSKKAAERRAAAYYLGEAGVDEAITKLATVYKSDPDPSVRRAAGYSLGMFRAVEQALARGEEQRVVGLLRRVSEDGRLGRRLPLRPRALAVIELVLALLLVALVALHLVLPDLGPLPGGIELPRLVADGPDAPADEAQPDRAGFVIAMQTTAQALTHDLATLQTQFQQALVGGALDCAAFFNDPAPLADADAAALAYPDLAPAIRVISDAHVTLVEAKARYEAACFDNDAIAVEAAGGLLAPIVAAQNALAEIEPLPALTEQAAAPATSTPTPEPTEIPPTATLEPTEAPPLTVAPTETVTLANSRRHLTALYGIIDAMRSPRGPGGLLTQYWADAARAGVTTACNEPTPSIPETYALPPEDAEASPELAQAVEQVNIGLDLIRQGWTLFHSSCQSGRLSEQSATGVQITSTADAAFKTAEGLLVVVRGQ